MNKKNITCLTLGIVFTFLSVVDIILEFCGISFFLFGKRVFSIFLGIFIALSAVLFAGFILSVLKNHSDNMSRKVIVAVKIITVLIAAAIVCLGLLEFLFFGEKTVHKDVSQDKRHEVFVETDALFGGWNVTVYKRYTPLFKVENTSFYINDMVSQDEEISVVWYDDGCDISYEYYSDYTDSDEPQTFTQRVYFNSKTE